MSKFIKLSQSTRNFLSLVLDTKQINIILFTDYDNFHDYHFYRFMLRKTNCKYIIMYYLLNMILDCMQLCK